MFNVIFPLNNGLSILQKEKFCLSIIDNDGQKKIVGRKVKKYKICSFALLRGIVFLFLGIYWYIKTITMESKLNTRPIEEQNKTYKKSINYEFVANYLLLFATMILSFVLGFVVLSFVPNFVINKLITEGNYYLKSFIVALMRISIIYLYFVLLRFCPFMLGMYRFNRAGQESLKALNKTENVNFLNFVVNVCLFSTFVISFIAINISWIANFFVNLAIFLLCTSFIYEILNFCAISKNSFVKDFSFISLWLVYAKPNTTQIEVASMAIIELDKIVDNQEYGKNQIPMSSVFAEMQTKLKACEKCEKSDMDWIVASVLNKGRAEVKLEKFVTKDQYHKIMSFVSRRAKGEPLSNMFGFVDFYGLKIEVNKKVLTPRSETEILVEKVLEKIKKIKAENVLDLCTGSGAIAVALAKFSNSNIFASDISKPALSLAQLNAQNNDVKVNFVESNLFQNFKKNKKFDIIVSNPPYIKSADIEKLEIEVKNYDPKLALDGGIDGYDYYKKIIEEAPSFLKKDGYLFFEVGQGQAKKVANLMKDKNFVDIEVVNDYNKIERIVYGRIN